MKIGAIVPQGWVGEYDGWDPLDAWRRTTEVARQADRLGFESIWLFDHFQTVPKPTDEITFESFTSLAALAALTERVRLGHIVICTAFRNPALTAKMISTMDLDQRRSDGARDRRRLEARRVARLRLRLPGHEGAPGPSR
ncbi:MAG: LLM class flavin-dependent oxidoreductase [Candidatus Limnocylindrales bacterium]